MREVREFRAAAAGFLVVLLYALLVLSTGRVPISGFVKLLGFYLNASFSLWLLMGLIAVLVQIYRNRPANGSGPSPFAVIARIGRDRWDRDRFVSLFWPPLLFALLMASFNSFKQMVLPAAGFGFDPAFAELDRMLFLGSDPWTVTHSMLSSPTATLVMDRAYHGWFVPMSLGVLLCSWLPVSTYRVRNRYLLSYIAIWVGIGSILAFILPSAGPCYYEHFIGPSQHFSGLSRDLLQAQSALGTKLQSLSNQAGLLRLFGSSEPVVGGGISAMPSVHNGLAVLFAIGAMQVNKLLGWTFAAYALLIWVSSIHLGWHYAADGLVAGALTGSIWFAVGRILEWLEKAAPAAEAETALA